MADAVLVWQNKHTTDYYDASTPEALEKSARKIIKSLLDDYQYIYEPDEEPSTWEMAAIDMDQVNMTDDEVAALPVAFQKTVKAHKKNYAALLKRIADDKQHYDRARDFAAGRVWEEKFRRQSRYDEETWAAILAKFPENPVRDGWMYRKASAWAFLQERNGYEYENFSIETVVGVDDE